MRSMSGGDATLGSTNIPCEKVTHAPRDHVAVLFKSEVASVEQIELQVLQITLVRMGSFDWKM